MSFNSVENHSVRIRTSEGDEFSHLLGPTERDAIHGALAANRPLLVRGEPGLGKSQLALASSAFLNRPYKTFTIDAHTEAKDLLYSFDAVQRLAEAQVAARVYKDRKELRRAIRISRFVSPGPLWWSLCWDSANQQQKSYLRTKRDEKPVFASPVPPAGWKPQDGIVILIDEIDKADTSLPNGLLEVLGSHQFTPIGRRSPILRIEGAKPPLIVITTNRERAMPPAFLRRCVILDLALPKYEENKLYDSADSSTSKPRKRSNPFVDYFVALGKAHFDNAIPESVFVSVAEMLHGDRVDAERSQTGTKPGPAEYLDLLRAMHEWTAEKIHSGELAPSDSDDMYIQLADRLREFFFSNKHREF